MNNVKDTSGNLYKNVGTIKPINVDSLKEKNIYLTEYDANNSNAMKAVDNIDFDMLVNNGENETVVDERGRVFLENNKGDIISIIGWINKDEIAESISKSGAVVKEDTTTLSSTENIETIEDTEDEMNKSEEIVDNIKNNEDIVDDINIEGIEENNIEDFGFRHEESNTLAKMAKDKGFTDDQIKIAIGISRFETGNYKHLGYGYNYGGVTGKGDAGSKNGYAIFSSAEVGMNAYLDNLKKNYFDMGLNTVDSMARKYLGYSSTSHWIKNVKACMK